MPVAADEPAPETPEAGEVIPGEVVVKWREDERAPARPRARAGRPGELGTSGEGLPSLLSTAGRAVNEVLAELRADPAVAYAEPNYACSSWMKARSPRGR